ncbi:zinc finger protein ZFAT [Eurytemora carolleeae]|uniref:zinc finger protein ZFAT n=1 Tax=Eurytemora carolleeae TaxID=1294199 RepID=UPI000C7723BC|nr:zinc finger protein ZFAT [Eurytemora carolleeae]|eukprot:XP_023321216.1 zinc finger protein ZFAT-like [Eurytemora affinis]
MKTCKIVYYFQTKMLYFHPDHERYKASNDIESTKVGSDDKRILKHIMIDILNLRNGMEDNLLLIQQIHLMVQKEGEEQRGFNDVIHAAQQHIKTTNSVYTLGVSWLKDETAYALSIIQGKESKEDLEMTGYDTSADECHEIKIEMEEIDEPGPLDPVDPSQVLVHQMKEEEGVFEDVKDEDGDKFVTRNRNQTLDPDKTNKSIFSCSLCEYQTQKRYVLKRHILVKHQGLRFKCDQCERSFSEEYSLRRHVSNIHEGKRYFCDECDFSASSSSMLKLHTDRFHLGIEFPCNICGHLAATKAILKVHKEIVHEKTRSFLCDQCDHKASNKGNLRLHIQNTHNTSIVYACDVCDYTTYNKVCYKGHKQRHVSQYLCELCPYIGKSKSGLQRHKQVKHDGIRFPCDQCNHLARDKVHLKTHKEAVHLGIKYPCEQCEFSASTKTNLKEHIACKHDETKYPCDQCEHVANTQYALRKHMKTKHISTSLRTSSPSN